MKKWQVMGHLSSVGYDLKALTFFIYFLFWLKNLYYRHEGILEKLIVCYSCPVWWHCRYGQIWVEINCAIPITSYLNEWSKS